MRKTETPEVSFHPEFCQEMLCHSDTALRCGIENCCPPEFMGNLARLSLLLANIQSTLGLAPGVLKINSGYRSPSLNERVGGVEGSQHCLGLAADIVATEFGSAEGLARAILANGLEFDQLILEFGRWVHVSVPPAHAAPRREVLSLFSSSEGYLEGIVSR